MELRTLLRRLDWILLGVTLGLLTYGVVMVHLASREDPLPSSGYYALRQLIFAGLGLAVAVSLALVDYERLRRWQWYFYGFAVASIAAVFVLGPVTRGSRRWIPLGLFDFQPSQLAVLLVGLGLAAFLVDRLDAVGSWRLTVLALGYAAVPAVLVFLQPDLGTATVIMAMAMGVLLFFGTPWTHFAALGGAVVVAGVLVLKVLPLLGINLVKPYQMDRLTVFLNKSADPASAGYNVRQAMIAVGSGGLSGRGDLATQTQLAFLPEHHTDFIFAVAAEHWGFLGAVGLLALYGILIWRGLRITLRARDMYGSVLAGGITTVFLYQVLVNVGMSLGIMPVTGIPLPFVSYGIAALITNLMLIGVLESVHLRGSEAQELRARVGGT